MIYRTYNTTYPNQTCSTTGAATHVRTGASDNGFFGGLWFVFFVIFPHILPRLLEVAVPLAEIEWAKGFVGVIADMIGTQLGNLL